ncbi:MAG: N-acetylmuramoyl-L-alanine amidase [Deltaproteobacteria bacterium]|nr:N-acetylmuramoyl-L-alanine amidase [Deltaproteobacteria bacterium]
MTNFFLYFLTWYFAATPVTNQNVTTLAANNARNNKSTNFLVVLDAGHGGNQSGARGVCGAYEKDVVLNIVLELNKLLMASGRVRTKLTRNKDIRLSLEERVQIANHEKANLFISVHANAAPGVTSHGVETFFVSQRASDKRIAKLALIENEGRRDFTTAENTLGLILDSLRLHAAHTESQRFAALVQQSVCSRLKQPNRGVLQAPFYVLRFVNMASVLVEVGFLSNPSECLRLNTPNYQRKIAQALAAAILTHVFTTEDTKLASIMTKNDSQK